LHFCQTHVYRVKEFHLANHDESSDDQDLVMVNCATTKTLRKLIPAMASVVKFILQGRDWTKPGQISEG